MARDPRYIKMINSKRWKDLRLKKLQANPLCEECQRKNKITLASEIHHIKEVESAITYEGMSLLMFDYSNLMSVCHECHVEIHREAFSHTKEKVQENNKRQTQRFIDKYL